MITYLELLELIKEGKQPCKIKVTISRFRKAVFGCIRDKRFAEDIIDAGWKVLDEIVEELKAEKGRV